MIQPSKFIDIEDHKKDEERIKTVVLEKYKREYKQYFETHKIKIKLTRPEKKDSGPLKLQKD